MLFTKIAVYCVSASALGDGSITLSVVFESKIYCNPVRLALHSCVMLAAVVLLLS